jgi:hypothetical protein
MNVEVHFTYTENSGEMGQCANLVSFWFIQVMFIGISSQPKDCTKHLS